MGIASWAFCGVVAGMIASLLPFGRVSRRPGHRVPPLVLECSIGAIAALIAGFAATALDFGGTRELDLRALLFAGSVALAAIGARRLARQMSKNGLRSSK